jgi:hypothetical protein
MAAADQRGENGEAAQHENVLASGGRSSQLNPSISKLTYLGELEKARSNSRSKHTRNKDGSLLYDWEGEHDPRNPYGSQHIFSQKF